MKKVLDKIWEWIKSTAWFQVVLIVGVVVGIVLSIQPIARAIQNGNAEAELPKYYRNNRISYKELINKIGNLDTADGKGFAVMFGTGNNTDTYEKGIKEYESYSGSVPIYYFNAGVTDANKSEYNADEQWFNYYKVEDNQISGLNKIFAKVYEEWKFYIAQDIGDEVEQTADYPSVFASSYTLVWFTRTSAMDAIVKQYNEDENFSYNDELKTKYNYHVGKVYCTLSSSTTATDLTKFFKSLEIPNND
ncbi:MAG: hypothetical protein J6I69_03860 [Bacilli bacterium]|jgi:hypothetical protein|nr:hypothetical protein [Bacilli bacterium]